MRTQETTKAFSHLALVRLRQLAISEMEVMTNAEFLHLQTCSTCFRLWKQFIEDQADTMTPGHISEGRLKELANDGEPETAELEHITKCSECFRVVTQFIRESIAEEHGGYDSPQ